MSHLVESLMLNLANLAKRFRNGPGHHPSGMFQLLGKTASANETYD